MRLFVPKEIEPESRVALTPEAVRKLIGLGIDVEVEAGAGQAADYADADYQSAGAKISSDRDASVEQAQILLRVRKPSSDEIDQMPSGLLHVSFLDPFKETALVAKLAQKGISAVSMEMMPRTTLAQKMDAISSQANLAGYYAVVKAAEHMNKILPMMMTPAGTIPPARVLVIGAGVAGLQAIATAKRLGARVEAFDVRPEALEQIRSVGAKPVQIDIGETGSTAQGYARQLTPEQLQRQQEGLTKIAAQCDLVITTAKVFGRAAPITVSPAMIEAMKPGSLVVDLAAEAGGNTKSTQLNEVVTTENGVRIMGFGALEAMIPHHSSQVYASNLSNFLEHFWNQEEKTFSFSLDDEILKGCLITHQGEIIHEKFRPQSNASE